MGVTGGDVLAGGADIVELAFAYVGRKRLVSVQSAFEVQAIAAASLLLAPEELLINFCWHTLVVPLPTTSWLASYWTSVAQMALLVRVAAARMYWDFTSQIVVSLQPSSELYSSSEQCLVMGLFVSTSVSIMLGALEGSL